MAEKYQDLGPLCSEIDAWIAQLWPLVNCRGRTVLTLAVSRLDKNFIVQVDQAGNKPWRWADQIDSEIYYHGCNPYALPSIMNDGLKESYGKGRYLGVWTSKQPWTSLWYPQHMKGGQAVCHGGPSIRALLACRASAQARKHFPGTRNRQGRQQNDQYVFAAQDLHVEGVIFVCVEAAATPIVDEGSMGVRSAKKWRYLLRRSEEFVAEIPATVRGGLYLEATSRTLPPPERQSPPRKKQRSAASSAASPAAPSLKSLHAWFIVRLSCGTDGAIAIPRFSGSRVMPC